MRGEYSEKNKDKFHVIFAILDFTRYALNRNMVNCCCQSCFYKSILLSQSNESAMNNHN